ncbi:ribosome silencing factor [Scytonema sp. UIC 10036]|uniref:ribosome silencing factor n=1 Tax=Scytonema sp. UIC 10036 TaxID=2304196 RepID=UPI0012DA5894|nr:ribosome silencing factor [Scytonema sp. UIC 10036]MUG98418.1 ribosome silencing factor [Scytonema sp. UIC 10036]
MTDSFQTNFPRQSVTVTNSSALSPLIDDNDVSGKMAWTIAEAGSDRKAGDILILKIGDVSYLADYFVMMTGYSRVQVRAIADAVEDKLETDWSRRPLRTEGKSEATWVLLDYGEVIVHVMFPKEREFYNLEAFWGHAERIDYTTSTTKSRELE